MKLLLLIAFLIITFGAYSQSEPAFSKDDNKDLKNDMKHLNKGEMQYLEYLGHLYLKYKDIDSLSKKGWDYITQCAYLGNESCCLDFGSSFYTSEDRNVYKGKANPDMDSAIKYLSIAANDKVEAWQMEDAIKAMKTLGELYLYGCNRYRNYKDPNRQDFVLAAKWYGLAAQHGDKYAADQIEVIKIAANNPFEKAATASKAGDYALALKLYDIASDINGDELAAYNAGVLYYNGQGVERSKDRALSYFQVAGRLGYAKGSNDAAEIYWEGGYGTSAIEWFTKAIEQGYTPAKEELASVKAQLSYNASKRAEFYAEYNRKQTELANKPITNQTTTTNNANNSNGAKPYIAPKTDPYENLHNAQQKAEKAVDNKYNTYKH